ncbi:MAG: RpiB/LacA/LacB family sugar-phosphate isomerase [Chitinophagaceae bacterium]|nr:RpiB/LacA/LacB family sugar-phosphate isomerase [Chitinophagaceae bacterium]
MEIGMAADHGGFELKEKIKSFLRDKGYTIKDFGANKLDSTDDYPDFVVPLAKEIGSGKIEKGIAICGSGIGASVAGNKVKGVRAALITDYFSAHQGVEDDNMNLLCLGGRVTGYASAEELVMAYLNAKFSGLERHNRRLQKVASLEK